jgi:hypothetical protein
MRTTVLNDEEFQWGGTELFMVKAFERFRTPNAGHRRIRQSRRLIAHRRPQKTVYGDSMRLISWWWCETGSCFYLQVQLEIPAALNDIQTQFSAKGFDAGPC